jgi:ABC-type phosphate transport system substrate-binding protein
MKTKIQIIMRTLRLAVLTLSVGLTFLHVTESEAAARIIVHPDVDVAALTQAEIARIYLGKKTFWESGDRIAPSLLNEESPLTESFLEESLKKTVRQYRAYWKRHLFSGQGTAPKTFASSKQVADFVAANPGAIGVVDPGYADDRVKVVALTP